MKTARARALNVIAAVDTAREQHPELGAPLTPRRLWRILATERIDVLHNGRIRRPARARGFDGVYIITLRHDLAPREAWRWALHEYAHIRLGHFTDSGEIVRQLSPCRKTDPREVEANLFGLLLVLGPSATPDDPRVAAMVADLTARRYREIAPAQLPLDLPPSFPARPARVQRQADATRSSDLQYERQLIRQGAQRASTVRTSWLAGPVITDRMTDDDVRIKFYDESIGAARFTDRRDVRWWIYNYGVAMTSTGQSVRRRIVDFMSREITHRLFVSSGGEQRVYRFANRREHRAYRVKHLDRQLAQARVLEAKRNFLRAILARSRR